jgi:hypothetical protein
MKRIRIRLDYVLEVEDDFDTTKFHAINDVIVFGLRMHPDILAGWLVSIEKGARISITNLRKNEHPEPREKTVVKP